MSTTNHEHFDRAPGSRVPLDHEVAANALLDIRKQLGSITPETVVSASESEDHPLHEFIWGVPQEEALEEFRLNRAREIIRSVRIKVVDPESKTVDLRQRAFVHSDVRGEYIPAWEVARDPILAIEERHRQLDMIRTWRNRLEAWGEYETLVQAMDTLLEAEAVAA